MGLFDFTASQDLSEKKKQTCLKQIKSAAKRCPNCLDNAENKLEMCSKHEKMIETIKG